MTGAGALVRTAALVAVLGLLLLAALEAVVSLPGAQFVLVAALAVPSGVLLAWKAAGELRTGVHITWRTAIDRRKRPAAFGLAVAFEAAAGACLLTLGACAALRLQT